MRVAKLYVENWGLYFVAPSRKQGTGRYSKAHQYSSETKPGKHCGDWDIFCWFAKMLQMILSVFYFPSMNPSTNHCHKMPQASISFGTLWRFLEVLPIQFHFKQVLHLANSVKHDCSPPARWGLDFMSDARLLLPPSSSSLPRRTSSASSRLHWASPDLICQLVIAMVLAGLQPARVWALWSSPDFNRRGSERCGPCRTSTGEGLSAVGLAGLLKRQE